LPIQSNERVSQGNYGKSLIIKKVKFEDKGKYTCEVSNGVGLPESYNIVLDVMGTYCNNMIFIAAIIILYEQLLK